MSKVRPRAIQNRQELNLRHGIKSSLNSWRQLIASLFLFSRFGGSDYCKEVRLGGKRSLVLDDAFSAWIDTNWSDIANVGQLVQQSPLFLAQMEPLQVGIELFLKLGKLSFVNASLAGSAERKGGDRYHKRVRLSTNMLVLENLITAYSREEQIGFVRQWLSGNDDVTISKMVKSVLVTFTEECQYKIRTANGEIYFQEDGVYAGLREANRTVESTDSVESVGPFRVLKTFVKEGLHPYLQDTNEGFRIRTSQNEFNAYADMVNATLDLCPKRTVIYQEVLPTQIKSLCPVTDKPRQQIRFGAPGTGKSFGLDKETGDDTIVFRTTFHPDSDYSTFVGAYKPTMKGEGEDEKIAYSFRPQAFMNAYVSAWKACATGGGDAPAGNHPKKVVLVIEEINRGNCAQIFGDLFQLLDRGEDGYSTYPIDADADLAKWLAEEDQFSAEGLGLEKSAELMMHDDDWLEVMGGKKLALPPNLYIWATMNTSDQSLFPIDSAFKRRWDWKYVPISKPTEDGFVDRKIVANGNRYDWWDFISTINGYIAKLTHSEDKQLGYFFVKAPDATGEITAEQFANKVLFYLFNDVFKDWDLPQKVFGKADGGKYAFKDFFYNKMVTEEGAAHLPGDVREEVVEEFIKRLMKGDSTADGENGGGLTGSDSASE